MAFYKLGDKQEMMFQLVNEQVKEDYVVWKSGVNVPFRVFDGVNARDIYFMKQEDFAQKYPNCRKDRQFIRDIVVYNAAIQEPPSQYLFGFKKTANDDLNKAITNNRNLGINPLEVLYKLRKTGQGIDTTYTIVVLERIGLPNLLKNEVKEPRSINHLESKDVSSLALPLNVQRSPLQPQIQQNTPQTKTSTTSQKEPIISPIKLTTLSQQRVVFGVPNVQKVVVLQDGAEKEIYEASCNYPEKLTEEKYIELWNDCARQYFNTQFELQRIKDIYRELYSK